MSTGDGICSICGLPLGPSSNPRVKTCQGHGGTAAIDLAALNATAPDAGDVEALKIVVRDAWATMDLESEYSDVVSEAIAQDVGRYVAAREAALRAECDALAAQVTTMRAVARRLLDAQAALDEHFSPHDESKECAECLDGGACEAMITMSDERAWAENAMNTALALTPTAAEERVRALERFWRAWDSLHRYRELPEEEYNEYRDMDLDVELTDAKDALRAEDGGAK